MFVKYEDDPLFVGRIGSLLEAHATEMDYKDYGADVEFFITGIRSKFVYAYSLNNDSSVVGYSAYTINRLHFRAHIRVATCLVTYIQPKYRIKGVWLLLRYAEQHLIASGVKQFFDWAPVNNPMVTIREKMGYTPKYTGMIKEV